MTQATASTILDFIQLERIEQDIFRGESKDLGTPQVYGGQVLGQALEAARLTVQDRDVHSVHAYFLRRGDFTAPIVYQVDRSRDGGSFSARRVVAIQHGQPIFTLSASFQKPEQGLDYYEPKQLPDSPDVLAQKGLLPDDSTRSAIRLLASDFEAYAVAQDADNNSGTLRWWIKSRERLPDEIALHKTVLAYVSDFGLLQATLLPHAPATKARRELVKKMVMASIDHAIWFHRPLRIDEWLLYECRPISTSNARGCAHGSVYDAGGVLVASTFQEGLIRLDQDY
ncbi:MAG: acyl-CoA thioesterase II [Gammaproteobacteria bacterium]|nr:acyl-CoA thioesterase II [Gammaproteobacteria bacterium]